MSRRLIVVASLFVAGNAYAQAPGEVQVVPVAPVAPVVFVAAPSVEVPVMANRWSVGLSLGSMGLSSESSPDTQTGFAIGELAVRFRATPHLEIEIALGGGRQHDDDGMEGDLEVSTAVVALRYRFMPYHRWNWYLLAGLGGASIVSHEASEQERHDATRGLFEFGVGVERRFAHFALSAELRGVALGDPKDHAETTPVAGGAMSEATTAPAPMSASDKVSGGQFTIGASYYF